MSRKELREEQFMKLFREMSEEQRRELCEKAKQRYAAEKPKLKLVFDSASPKKGGE